MPDDPSPFEQPVQLAIDGELDLHTFHPSELSPLLHDYIEACRATGILSLRVIHGKGQGMLRERVHRLLAKHPAVKAFALAPPEAGGWGATLVELKPLGESPDFSVDPPEVE
jgi:DNA-nicking Smr family endonuclease